MIAYYIYDADKQDDWIVLPQMGCRVSVNTEVFLEFISVNPIFSKWSGNACGDLNPDDFGTVISTREEGGDVCILKEDLWQSRMRHYLGDEK